MAESRDRRTPFRPRITSLGAIGRQARIISPITAFMRGSASRNLPVQDDTLQIVSENEFCTRNISF